MDSNTISLLIKWGPLIVVTVIFLWWFLWGVIRGSYKVLRRLIYVVLFVFFTWLFIGKITDTILDLNITINGVQGVRNYIVHVIENSDALHDFLQYSPNLKEIIINSPHIIINPILFIVLVFIGLPLSYPIYWFIYLPIYNLIAKLAFKREKYEKDSEGNILRNEKGKKIKVKRKKYRLLGGVIRGVQGVALFCLVLMPVNMINRIYNKAKGAASLEKGETLCDISDSLDETSKANCRTYIKYIDLYNESIFAKLGGEHSLDKVLNDRLTTIKYSGNKVSLENELSSVAVSAVLLSESGVLELFLSGEFNLDTVDFGKINFEKLDLFIDSLFSSTLISEISEAGIKYVLNEVLKDNLVDLLKDEEIVTKLEYENAGQIKKELKDVVSILKFAIEKELDDKIITNKDDAIAIVNSISGEDVETLINKVLSLRILNNAMPSVIKTYGEKYGVQVPETMTEELNSEVAGLFGDAIKFVNTMGLTKIEDITEGNIVDNLADALFENGALKSSSKESLASLLNDLNQSYLFKNVLSTQINELLEKKDYNVDARILKYVDSKEAWLKELGVLEKVYELYDGYNTNEVVDYSKVTGLLNEVSGTKLFISVLPFAYDELLPKVGIEIDSEGLPVIEFDNENEDSSKKEFYDTWEEELTVLKNIADAAGVLELQSLEGINIDLIKDEEKVDALSTIMGEIYNSDLLREPIVGFMKDTINEFVVDYDVEFTKEELLSINNKDKWKNEFTNINSVLEIDLSEAESINSTNLNTIFTAIGNMELFKQKKIDMLKYAIKESDFLTEEEYDGISWPQDNASQSEIDAFWNNESEVLVSIVDKKDSIEDLSNVTIETLNVEELGEIVNETMKSNILKPIVVDKISELLVDNGVKDDKDEEGSSLNLKNSIGGVTDWKVELANVKEMVNSVEQITTTKYLQISAYDAYDRSGNEGNYTYTPSATGSYIKVEEEYYLVENAYRYDRSGSEGNYTYTQVDDGEYLKVSETRVDDIFASIESSELLQNSRANLLLKAVETIDIVDIPSTVTVAELSKNEYDLYEKERDIIIEVSKNKNAFDNLSTMDLNDIDTDEIGGLLNTVTNSIIFKDYVVDQIVTVFVNNDVKDDRDSGTSTTNLRLSIEGVNDWASEFDIIKEMLNIDAATFNAVSEGKTTVERMFDNIENSELLKNTRANLLIKAVGLINIDGINTNNVTVSSLKDTYNEEAYYQYNREVDVFVAFAENKEAVDTLSDITSLSGTQKVMMASLLDAMELSSLLKDKYESTIDGAVSGVKNNESLTNYGVTFKSAAQARDVNWNTEIDNLITIKNNIQAVAGYTDQDIIDNRVSTINIIGSTLDAVASSSFLGETQSNNIANAVVTELTKNLPDSYKVTSISKNDGETWSAAFDRVVRIPGI